MDIITGICDRMLVLSYGEVIDTGIPKDVIADPRVIKAYLGSAHAPAA
jgi:branched-chain amino acid transport system ATP-binding protein